LTLILEKFRKINNLGLGGFRKGQKVQPKNGDGVFLAPISSYYLSPVSSASEKISRHALLIDGTDAAID